MGRRVANNFFMCKDSFAAVFTRSDSDDFPFAMPRVDNSEMGASASWASDPLGAILAVGFHVHLLLCFWRFAKLNLDLELEWISENSFNVAP